jgi:hypothetical protein
VHREIQALLLIARDNLVCDGYYRDWRSEPLFDDSGSEGVENVIGCTYSAKDDDGAVAREDIYYPDGWFERERNKA